MNTVLDIDLLKQTMTPSVRESYDSVRSKANGTLTQQYANDLTTGLNKILLKYELSEFQKEAVERLFVAFTYIQEQIDPAKIRFDDALNEDDELILHRSSEFGVSTLIIHDDELIAYSFLGKGQSTILDFYQDQVELIDYEKLAFAFLSK